MKKYNDQKFTTGSYTEYFKSIILNFTGFQQFKKINGNYLDIGCGSGTQIFSLAPYFKNFLFTGIDLSEPNISSCNKELSSMSDRWRFDFIHDDFIEYNFHTKFSLAFSYSVFQLMQTPMDELLKQVWELLQPNGYFLLSMPYHCKYNKYLNYFRGFLGIFRCKLFDWLMVNMAYLLYRKKFSKSFLKERMIYLDQVDYNLLDVKKIEALHPFWKIEFQEMTPSPSFIQSRHMTIILKKSR
ncbi:MAG: class I SAM-dependent methyltransferase [Deltaproteobacteria bacterium]|nr:class I SAM-dependent methyltransferase [Deltaproteobacteria bacterium]